jgi:hypothetical protein
MAQVDLFCPPSILPIHDEAEESEITEQEY